MNEKDTNTKMEINGLDSVAKSQQVSSNHGKVPSPPTSPQFTVLRNSSDGTVDSSERDESCTNLQQDATRKLHAGNLSLSPPASPFANATSTSAPGSEIITPSVQSSSTSVPPCYPALSAILQREAAKLKVGDIQGTLRELRALRNFATLDQRVEISRAMAKIAREYDELKKGSASLLKKQKQPFVPLVKKRTAPVDDDPERDLFASEFRLLYLTLRMDSKTLISFSDVLGDGYVTSLDYLVNMPNLAQRRVLLVALKRVGKAFDDTRDGKSAVAEEMPMTGKSAPESDTESSDNDKNITKLEKCLLPYASMASTYVKAITHKYRGGTSSLHTYESNHTHNLQTCTIKHEEETYPFGFNASLLSTFRKCSRQRLQKERQERRAVLVGLYKKGLVRKKTNPLLDEDIIKECGNGRYRDLEGRVEMQDLRDAACWELTNRHVEEKSCRKNRTGKFRARKSPLRNELRKLDDHWIREDLLPFVREDKVKIKVKAKVLQDRKRKRDVDEEEERERYRKREEEQSDWFNDYMAQEMVKDQAIEKEREEKRARIKERKEKSEREKREKELRGVDRVAWKNRERSDCSITQIWIDLGVDLARLNRWSGMKV